MVVWGRVCACQAVAPIHALGSRCDRRWKPSAGQELMSSAPSRPAPGASCRPCPLCRETRPDQAEPRQDFQLAHTHIQVSPCPPLPCGRGGRANWIGCSRCWRLDLPSLAASWPPFGFGSGILEGCRQGALDHLQSSQQRRWFQQGWMSSSGLPLPVIHKVVRSHGSVSSNHVEWNLVSLASIVYAVSSVPKRQRTRVNKLMIDLQPQICICESVDTSSTPFASDTLASEISAGTTPPSSVKQNTLA